YLQRMNRTLPVGSPTEYRCPTSPPVLVIECGWAELLSALVVSLCASFGPASFVSGDVCILRWTEFDGRGRVDSWHGIHSTKLQNAVIKHHDLLHRGELRWPL